MRVFRNSSPKRTCTKKYANYRSYKPYLVDDFDRKCGYTNCPDYWFGGKRTFHIDHFKPKSIYPKLELEYSNLVYCCSYVNILKSDDDGNYIDPCDVDFNDHFERDENGNILPKSDSKKAKYMYDNLKLYLKRYRIIWQLDELYTKMKKMKNVIEGLADSDYKKELLVIQGELANEFVNYFEYLKLEQ